MRCCSRVVEGSSPGGTMALRQSDAKRCPRPNAHMNATITKSLAVDRGGVVGKRGRVEQCGAMKQLLQATQPVHRRNRDRTHALNLPRRKQGFARRGLRGDIDVQSSRRTLYGSTLQPLSEYQADSRLSRALSVDRSAAASGRRAKMLLTSRKEKRRAAFAVGDYQQVIQNPRWGATCCGYCAQRTD